MTKKKTVAKKVSVPKTHRPPKTVKKVSKKSSPSVVKEITTVETTKNGYWSKIITITYARDLLCPAFFSKKLLMLFASVPLIILIGLIIWRIFYYE